jgi:hypothetical protein
MLSRKPKDADIIFPSRDKAYSYALKEAQRLNNKYGQSRFTVDKPTGDRANAQLHDSKTGNHYDFVGDPKVRIVDVDGVKMLDIKSQEWKKLNAITDPDTQYRTFGVEEKGDVISLKKDFVDKVDMIKVRNPKAVLADYIKPQYKNNYDIIVRKDFNPKLNETPYFLVKRGAPSGAVESELGFKRQREQALKEKDAYESYAYKKSVGKDAYYGYSGDYGYKGKSYPYYEGKPYRYGKPYGEEGKVWTPYPYANGYPPSYPYMAPPSRLNARRLIVDSPELKKSKKKGDKEAWHQRALVKAWEPVLMDSNGAFQPTGEFFKSEEEAAGEGMLATIKSPLDRFMLRERVVPQEVVKRGRDNEFTDRFQKRGNIYIEENTRRTKAYKSFNIYPYVYPSR